MQIRASGVRRIFLADAYAFFITSSDPASYTWGVGMMQHFRTGIASVILLTFLTGCLFPSALLLIGRILFREAGEGSLLTRDGVVVGSRLIGQDFNRPEYFHSRPSAAGTGYDGTSSGGSNLGPSNPKLLEGVRRLADDYRKSNGLPADAEVPIDAVTRSGSGLDPEISPANAALQISRVARARSLTELSVRRLVDGHTLGRQFGFLGSPRVSVLELNLALDRTTAAPRR